MLGLGLTAATSAPGPCSPLPNVRWDQAQLLPHLRRDSGSLLPHLHWDSAHHCDISPGSRLTCAGTGLTASACTSRLSSPLSQFCLTRLASTTSAPRLGSLLPQLRRTRMPGLTTATSAPGTRLAAATFAPRLGSIATSVPRLDSLPHVRRGWLTAGTSAPALGSPLPHLCQDRPNAGLIVRRSYLSVVCGFQVTGLEVSASGLTPSSKNLRVGKSANLHTSAEDLARSAHDFAKARNPATSARHSSPFDYGSVTNMCARTR